MEYGYTAQILTKGHLMYQSAYFHMQFHCSCHAFLTVPADVDTFSACDPFAKVNFKLELFWLILCINTTERGVLSVATRKVLVLGSSTG